LAALLVTGAVAVALAGEYDLVNDSRIYTYQAANAGKKVGGTLQVQPGADNRPEYERGHVNMEQAVQTEVVRPPLTNIGIIGWVKNNLFNGVFNSILTVVTLFFLWKVAPPLFRWALIDSAWHTTGQACRQAAGACWSIISMNYRFILFGFYPYDLQWRPLLAMLILFSLLFYSRERNHWKRPLAYAWIIGLFTMGLLMKGGIFGLTSVESTQWGGLPLTLLLAVFGLTVAYPLGVILALADLKYAESLSGVSNSAYSLMAISSRFASSVKAGQPIFSSTWSCRSCIRSPGTGKL
jgi:hypothetical protein